MTFLLVIAFFLVATLSAAHLLKSSFAVLLPSILFSVALVLYVFGALNILGAGYVVVLISVAVLAVTAFVHRGPRRILHSLRGAITPSIVLFIAYALISFILTRDMRLANWDEFSHWGATVKATFIYDAIAPYNPVELVYRSYPPALTLFEYFIMKLGGGWHEGNLFWAYQLLFFSLFFPFTRAVKWHSLDKLLAIVPLMTLTPFVIFHTYEAIFVDPFLGLLFGYALTLVYTGNPRSRSLTVHLSLALAMLVLTKDSGAFFAAVVLVLLLSKFIHQRYPVRATRNVIGALLAVGVPALVVVVCYTTWKSLLAGLQVPAVFSDPIDLGELSGLLDGTGRPYWEEVIRGFSTALTDSPISSAQGYLLSHVFWLLLAAIFLVLLELVRGRLWGRAHDYSATMIILAGAVLYTIGLLVLYLFRFSEYEAVNLASFDRYLGTYWVGVVMFLSLCAIVFIAEDEDGRQLSLTSRSWYLSSGIKFSVLWLAVLIVVAPIRPLANFVRNPVALSMTARADYLPVIEAANAAGVDGDDRVWIISQFSTGYEYWILRYELMPSPVNYGYWTLGKPKDSSDIWTADLAPEDWSQQLEEYDYVLVHVTNPSFAETYGGLFENVNDLENNAIFKVTDQGGATTLVRVP